MEGAFGEESLGKGEAHVRKLREKAGDFCLFFGGGAAVFSEDADEARYLVVVGQESGLEFLGHEGGETAEEFDGHEAEFSLIHLSELDQAHGGAGTFDSGDDS